MDFSVLLLPLILFGLAMVYFVMYKLAVKKHNKQEKALNERLITKLFTNKGMLEQGQVFPFSLMTDYYEALESSNEDKKKNLEEQLASAPEFLKYTVISDYDEIKTRDFLLSSPVKSVLIARRYTGEINKNVPVFFIEFQNGLKAMLDYTQISITRDNRLKDYLRLMDDTVRKLGADVTVALDYIGDEYDSALDLFMGASNARHVDVGMLDNEVILNSK